MPMPASSVLMCLDAVRSFSLMDKPVNSNLDWGSSLPVYVQLLPRLSDLRAAGLVWTHHKQEMSSLNLHLSLQACLWTPIPFHSKVSDIENGPLLFPSLSFSAILPLWPFSFISLAAAERQFKLNPKYLHNYPLSHSTVITHFYLLEYGH